MFMHPSRPWFLSLVCAIAVTVCLAGGAADVSPPVELTAQQDHQRLMDLLHITSIRRGRDGNNRNSTNYANYDQSKDNPFPNLPDPLVLKSGAKVTTSEMWW